MADRTAGQLDGRRRRRARSCSTAACPSRPARGSGARLLSSPVVALSERVEEASVPFVGIDNVRAARDVAHPSPTSATAASPRSRGRPATACPASAPAASRPGRAERNLAVLARASGDFSVAAGERAAAALLSGRRPPDGDLRRQRRDGHGSDPGRDGGGARRCRAICRSSGSTTSTSRSSTPRPLTTVRQPRHALGRAAIAVVEARIGGGPAPRPPVILGHELVLRDSAGPPRRASLPRRKPHLAAAGVDLDLMTEEERLPKTLKGPGLFLAQFAGDAAPFDTLDGICRWAAGLGYKGVQIPTWDARLFDLARAAESKTYCDEVAGTCRRARPRRDRAVDPPAGPARRRQSRPTTRRSTPSPPRPCAAGRRSGRPGRSTSSGSRPVRRAISASHRASPSPARWPGPSSIPGRSARPASSRRAFAELARRWTPILDAYEEAGCDLCFELHPGEDVFDGATFEQFLDAAGGHRRLNINYDPSHFLLQGLDYLGFLDLYRERIRAFHVKDAEFNPTARQGFYSGFRPWIERAARFRSLGDGQVDFGGIFSKLAQHGYEGWAVLEWECCLKHPEDGAREGAAFIAGHIIRATEKAFDDFAGSAPDEARNRRMLGIE